MIKKIITLLLCLVLVFSITGTFVAVEGGEDQYQQESFSVVEKNLITGEETTKNYDASNYEYLLEDFYQINQFNDISNFRNDVVSPCDIIGDNNMQIVEDTTNWPYSAVAFIVVDWPGLFPSTRGTAFMISENVAATAAHNLYDSEHNVWAESVTVYPGKDGLISNPFGSLESYSISVSDDWVERGDRNYDWGVIALDGYFSVIDVGFFNITTFPDYTEINTPITVCGYPNTGSLLNGFNQYISNGVISDIAPLMFLHTADTLASSSGSPILNERDEVIGINVASSSQQGNIGVKINDEALLYFFIAILNHQT